jgi:hypothetical protein
MRLKLNLFGASQNLREGCQQGFIGSIVPRSWIAAPIFMGSQYEAGCLF